MGIDDVKIFYWPQQVGACDSNKDRGVCTDDY